MKGKSAGFEGEQNRPKDRISRKRIEPGNRSSGKETRKRKKSGI